MRLLNKRLKLSLLLQEALGRIESVVYSLFLAEFRLVVGLKRDNIALLVFLGII
jgi:hypothetical protein